MNFQHQLLFSKLINFVVKNINSFEDFKYYKNPESSNVLFTIFNTKTLFRFKLNDKILNLNNKTYKFVDVYYHNCSIFNNIQKS